MSFLNLFLLLLACVAVRSSLIVQTKNGAVQGTYCDWPFDDVRFFGGLQYGEMPVGKLRFMPPVAFNRTYPSTFDATGFGFVCNQVGGGGYITNWVQPSEDCLNLNVWTPTTIKSPLPVMIFFYGGSWEEGATSLPLYSGQTIVQNSGHNVVVVTVNYRVSSFGFLGSRELQKVSADGSTGNAGILDQRLAMRWVQDNIDAFGGNAQLVTIFGESAGAASVSNHLVMPKSANLFHRAIIESGPFTTWTCHNLNDSQVMFEATAEQCGCAQQADVVRCLQQVDVDCLISVPPPTRLTMTWAPTIDGVELTDSCQALAQQGKLHRVPVLMGTNRDEGTILIGLDSNITIRGAFDYYQYQWGPNLAPAVAKLYPPATMQPWWAVNAAFGDADFQCATQRSANWLSDANMPTFIYYFAYELPVVRLFDPTIGVCHASELLFVFDLESYDGIPLPWLPKERQLQQTFVSYWTNFATTGDPNKGPNSVPLAWPKWTNNSTQQQMMQLDETPQILTNNRQQYCQFWNKHFNITN